MFNGSAIFLILLLFPITIKCHGVENTLEKLDVMLADAKFFRHSRQDKFAKDSSLIWQDYEFETGAGNREELTITNVSIEKYGNLPETEVKWQFLEVAGAEYLASAERSTLSFYKLYLDNVLVNNAVNLNVNGVISTFKVLALNNNFQADEGPSRNEIIAVLCVKSASETSLQWYRLLENQFLFFWSWPVQRHIKDMELIQHEDKNKLLLLGSGGVNFEKEYSLIDVYGFNINFSNIGLNTMWLCQSTTVPETFDIQICPIYESISLALHGANDVFLYQYTDNAVEGGLFLELPTIKSQDLRNFVCFESGYIQYLAVSGKEAGLYSFFENEFQYDTESGQNFEVSEVSWIKDIKLNTYRDESLLLVQLKNSTVIVLAWQGAGFKRVELPNKILDQFDISKVTVIPRFGFVSRNQFVRFDTELKSVKRPSHDETEGMISTQALLEIVFHDQESIINETNGRIEKSYLNNPVITGFWDLKSVNATRATVKKNVTYQFIAIGSTDLTVEDWRYNLSTYVETFNSLEEKLNETNLNLEHAVDAKLKDVDLESDLEISGSINIKGTLNVNKFTAEYINDIPVSSGSKHLRKDNTEIIIDHTIFDSMETENLRIRSINGMNPKDIYFENWERSFDKVDFSKMKRLIVDGHLNVPILNEFVWESLMRNVVWKDKPAVISGSTVVDGALIADEVRVKIVNDIPYPSGYILQNSTTSVNVLAYKTFDKLSITNSLNLNSLNGIDIDDFILVHGNNVLNEEITFENLVVDGSLQIDKDIIGLNADRVVYLNETTNISSNIAISRLTVLGDIILENSIGDKSLLNFEDLLLRTDKNPEITGRKTFLSGVELLSNVTITSDTINGHRTDEFVTLNTEQGFLNLEKISANVTFEEVNHGAIRKLEDLLKASYKQNGAGCWQKIIIFKHPIAADKLSFNTIRNNVSEKAFQRKLSETFQRVHFDSVTATNLEAEAITGKIVNGIEFTRLVERLTAPHTVEDRTIENFDISNLRAKSINSVPLDELILMKDQAESLNQKIHNGDMSFESLHVTGKIDAESINEIILSDMYSEKRMGTVIFEEDVSIENLTVLGTINGFNFTEYVNDAIFKTDQDIVVNGRKTFDSINCQYLETSKLNGHPVENILDSTKEQTLSGPVIIKGSVNVLRKFDANGKVGNVLYHDLTERFKLLDSNTYQLLGDLQFTNDVSMKNLRTNGLIQGVLFDDFMKTTISKHETHVTISGAKIFKDSVTFNGPLTVQDVLNGLDLRKFYKTALYIDKDFSIDLKIIFESGISVEKDLIVLSDLNINTIMGVNMTELQASIIYLNRPTYIRDLMTFSSVTFQSNIKVDKINDVDMQLLIPLNTEQTLSVEVLKCTNVTAEGIKISGQVNGYELNTLYKNTFMLFGDQNVSGIMNFHGNVYARKDFNTRLINEISPKQIILLNTKETLTGNFVFKHQVVLDRSLRVLGKINGISVDRWRAIAVRTSFPLKQIISGQWSMYGNVYVEKRMTYNGILNGVNVSELSDFVARHDLEMDVIIAESKMNLENICDDLLRLRKFAENQIYKFNTFDYLQVLEFDQNIVSIHYFELEDLDYLLVSYDTCHMNTFLFTGEKFELVANVPNFGAIDEWATFEFNEVLYFVTIGGNTCRRSPGNLWKLENDEFTHVLSLGNLTDKRHITQETFLGMMNSNKEKRSIPQLNEKPIKYASYEATDSDSKHVLKDDRFLLASRHFMYEYGNENENVKNVGDYVGYTGLSFKAGRTEKDLFLYYDEDISENYIFVCNDGTSYKKILQTIESHKPSSLLVLNFEGLTETLLIFVENGRNLRIYEYRGIEGFVYKDSIRIDVEKLFNFKLRKSSNLVKRNCLALISGKRLTLLEAKMYGEKLDMGELSCVNN